MVTPYASLLAVAMRPRTVVENLAKLEAMGMLGAYGLCEAVDLRPDRTPDGRPHAVGRSYLAHHQGMLFRRDRQLSEPPEVMVDRFHASALGSDRRDAAQREGAHDGPAGVARHRAHRQPDLRGRPRLPTAAPAGWSPHRQRPAPGAFALSNGRLTSSADGLGRRRPPSGRALRSPGTAPIATTTRRGCGSTCATSGRGACGSRRPSKDARPTPVTAPSSIGASRGSRSTSTWRSRRPTTWRSAGSRCTTRPTSTGACP